jgi:hypothetical protein
MNLPENCYVLKLASNVATTQDRPFGKKPDDYVVILMSLPLLRDPLNLMNFGFTVHCGR